VSKVQECTLTGRLPAQFANKISDVIHEFVNRGMEVDEASCIAVAVAADYARSNYGNSYLGSLTEVIRERANRPLPMIVEPAK
jgi:ribosomal protein S18 acetylase RimI-like enzyme